MSSQLMELAVKQVVVLKTGGSVKAMCDISVGEQFLIHGVRVVDGRNGPFVSMPRSQGKNGKWYDIVEPLSASAKQELTRLVLEAYSQQCSS